MKELVVDRRAIALALAASFAAAPALATGLAPGVGKMQEQLPTQAAPEPQFPAAIYEITPAAGRVGAWIAIAGANFTCDNTVHIGAAVIRHVGVASAIGIACTTSPSCRSGIRQSLEVRVPRQPLRAQAGGTVELWVENANGRSPALRFVLLPDTRR